jgi:acyl carrier protein
MVPQAFISIDEVPFTPNRKLDRAQLPTPTAADFAHSDASLEPRNETEAAVLEIFKSLLKVGAIGIQDDFFELGGHSLMAVQCVSRIQSRFSVDLPLRTLFLSPTAELLAAEIETIIEEESHSDVIEEFHI